MVYESRDGGGETVDDEEGESMGIRMLGVTSSRQREAESDRPKMLLSLLLLLTLPLLLLLHPVLWLNVSL